MPVKIFFTYYLPPWNNTEGLFNVEFEIQATLYENGMVYCNPIISDKIVNYERMAREIIMQAREELDYINRQQTVNRIWLDKFLADAGKNDEKGSHGINAIIFLIILLII